MAAPLNDLVQVFRRIFKVFRWVSFGIIGVTVFVLAMQLAQIHGWLAAAHPAFGHAFLLLVAGVLFFCVGIPLARYIKVPVVLKPPELPSGDDALTMAHVKRRVRFLSRYVASLRRNPLLADQRPQVEETLRICEDLARRIETVPNAAAAMKEVGEFETTRLDALLEPIDAEADKVIRREALGVGLATAVSPNGTLDAFIVLWRNANMVSRIANLYYGRPGARGSLIVLRDVSAATLLATYLEGLSDMAGGLIGSLFGGIAGTLAGPVIDGSVNALATLRIGYTARARCRSFQAWTEKSRAQALKEAFAMAKARSREVLGEIVRSAEGGITQLGGKVVDAAKGGLGSLWRKVTGQDAEGATS
jgi:putative membrane protein